MLQGLQDRDQAAGTYSFADTIQFINEPPGCDSGTYVCPPTPVTSYYLISIGTRTRLFPSDTSVVLVAVDGKGEYIKGIGPQGSRLCRNRELTCAATLPAEEALKRARTFTSMNAPFAWTMSLRWGEPNRLKSCPLCGGRFADDLDTPVPAFVWRAEGVDTLHQGTTVLAYVHAQTGRLLMHRAGARMPIR